MEKQITEPQIVRNTNKTKEQWSSFYTEVFCKKGVLIYFAKFIGKYLCRNHIFNQVTGLRPATFLKARLRHKCFSVNFAELLRTTILKNTSGRLLLKKTNHRTATI